MTKEELINQFFDIHINANANEVVAMAVVKFSTTFKRVRKLRTEWEKNNKRPDVYVRLSRRNEPLYKGEKRQIFVFNTDKLFDK